MKSILSRLRHRRQDGEHSSEFETGGPHEEAQLAEQSRPNRSALREQDVVVVPKFPAAAAAIDDETNRRMDEPGDFDGRHRTAGSSMSSTPVPQRYSSKPLPPVPSCRTSAQDVPPHSGSAAVSALGSAGGYVHSRPLGTAPAGAQARDHGRERRFRRSADGSHGHERLRRLSLDSGDIPPRTTSLNAAQSVPRRSSHRAHRSLDFDTSRGHSRHGPGIPKSEANALDSQLGRLSLANSAPLEPATVQEEPPALRSQRTDMVERIAQGARNRTEAQGEIGAAGRQVFRAAGLEATLDTRGTVDVGTRWMEPVVQEVIKPKVHTEYTTIIDREIDKHHVYPRIQPVEDPNPIELQPKHRIFSVTDGKWHEVEGDASAIELLGRETFDHGEKEVRYIREPVHEDRQTVPNTALMAPDTDATRRTGQTGRVIERESVGNQLWHRHLVEGARGDEGRRVVDDDLDYGPSAGEERTMGIAI